jgi:hypothetical protein
LELRSMSCLAREFRRITYALLSRCDLLCLFFVFVGHFGSRAIENS